MRVSAPAGAEHNSEPIRFVGASGHNSEPGRSGQARGHKLEPGRFVGLGSGFGGACAADRGYNELL